MLGGPKHQMQVKGGILPVKPSWAYVFVQKGPRWLTQCGVDVVFHVGPDQEGVLLEGGRRGRHSWAWVVAILGMDVGSVGCLWEVSNLVLLPVRGH